MITDRAGGSTGFASLGFCLSFLMFLPLVSAVAVTSAAASPSQASAPINKDYALIYGTVWGPDGRRVPGIPLKIRRASDKKPKWELTSDGSGEFAQRVPPGAEDYVIQADVKVPKGHAKPEITVHIDNDERKDVGLHLTQQELHHN